MFSVLILLTYFYSSLHNIPPPLQAICLLPLLTTYVLCKHHSSQKHLPDLISQPVHHHCKQEGTQGQSHPDLEPHLSLLPHTSHNNCLAVLIHVLHHPHIFLCHSWLPHAELQFISWHPIICFLDPLRHSALLTRFDVSINTQRKHRICSARAMKPYWCSLIITSLLNLVSTTLNISSLTSIYMFYNKIRID